MFASFAISGLHVHNKTSVKNLMQHFHKEVKEKQRTSDLTARRYSVSSLQFGQVELELTCKRNLRPAQAFVFEQAL